MWNNEHRFDKPRVPDREAQKDESGAFYGMVTYLCKLAKTYIRFVKREHTEINEKQFEGWSFRQLIQ